LYAAFITDDDVEVEKAHIPAAIFGSLKPADEEGEGEGEEVTD